MFNVIFFSLTCSSASVNFLISDRGYNENYILLFAGHIDHSARVMRVITWNRSFKGRHNTDDGRDDFDNDEWETHATVLDKMLAWEKKLYEEVKVCSFKLSFKLQVFQLSI